MEYITATFIVKLTDHPTSEPDEVWVLSLDSFEMPADDIIKELEALTWLRGAEYPAMSHISSRQGITNWGASSSFMEFVLEMSSNGMGGVTTVVVSEAVKALYSKLRRRSQGDHWGNVISEETAIAVAKQRIASQYDVEGDSLTLSRSETDAANHSFHFTFSHPDGRSFGAEVGILRDAPTCMRIWRQVAPE
ncbi:hypothetical protein DEJ48_18795 [Streptomyces venezuelae]|uniref:Uncharacterized protein n=1 Tax=Streptomyces venezuelae TaxID=54571 RepID=A0A5P2BYY7_STRVZ|nr:hypothetical protein [Streptomyces venezuelae]QES35190.1 hypothetical protein DEJ48_18795 [Streptomyces venezuelae]